MFSAYFISCDMFRSQVLYKDRGFNQFLLIARKLNITIQSALKNCKTFSEIFLVWSFRIFYKPLLFAWVSDSFSTTNKQTKQSQSKIKEKYISRITII